MPRSFIESLAQISAKLISTLALTSALTPALSPGEGKTCRSPEFFDIAGCFLTLFVRANQRACNNARNVIARTGLPAPSPQGEGRG